jgi:methyl-accepting chemotaxis protein
MAAPGNPVEVTVRRGALAGWFADRGVNTKGLAVAVVAAAVALGVGGLSVNRMAELNADLESVNSQQMESLERLGEIRHGIGEAYRGMFLFELGRTVRDPRLSARAKGATADADAAIDEAVAGYRTVAAGSPERAEALTGFTEARQEYRNLRDAAIFGVTPPAGVTVPPPAELENAFTMAERDMNTALAALQELEHAEAAAIAAEAASEYRAARTQIILALVLGLLLAAGAAAWVTRVTRRQLHAVETALEALAEGDLTRVAEVRTRDELGRMAAAVNRAGAAIRQTVTTLSDGARTLGDSSRQLAAVTAQIGASAQEAAAQANLVAAAAGDVSNNVQTVAAGSEEMGSSIRQIAQNANDAAQVAAEAVGVAESTNHTVSKLGESSTEIGNVVKVITSIAEQTNLLALNATIEAARAGEAGKGFAVVANEVKELAQETARATEDISQRVEAIQSDSMNAVAAIADIGRIIGRINDYQLTIASAVEEQTATTGEMSRSVGEAAGGTSDIAANIGGVAEAAQSTTATLAEADRTAAELSRLAEQLQAAVSRFRL